MSGSLESVRWNACAHRLDLGLYSRPKEFGGKESDPHDRGEVQPLAVEQWRGHSQQH